MESQESKSTFNQSKILNQYNDSFLNCEEKPLCPGKYEATHLCLNPKCKTLTERKSKSQLQNPTTSKTTNNSFICSSDICQVCFGPHSRLWKQTKKQVSKGRLHQKCYIGDYNILLSCIKQKRKDCQPLKDSINKIFDDFIDYLSDLRQKYLDELKYHGLSLNQQKFLSCFENKQYGEITSKLSLQIINHLPNQLKDNVVKAQKMLEEYWKGQEVKAKELFESIEKNISKEEVYIIDRIPIDSRVVVSDQEQLDLIEMLQGQQKKPVKSLDLLYRGTEHNFDSNKFHNKCDLIEHTVVVMETEHGKKIGAYTPLVWDRLKNSKSSLDPSGKSFIFSLTNNHKFNLISKDESAIFQYSDWGQAFGSGHDIFIANRGNINSCYANVGKSYTHPEYQFQNQNSWTKFSGTIEGRNFKLKEWEVFQVKWSQK